MVLRKNPETSLTETRQSKNVVYSETRPKLGRKRPVSSPTTLILCHRKSVNSTLKVQLSSVSVSAASPKKWTNWYCWCVALPGKLYKTIKWIMHIRKQLKIRFEMLKDERHLKFRTTFSFKTPQHQEGSNKETKCCCWRDCCSSSHTNSEKQSPQLVSIKHLTLKRQF